MDYLKGKVEEVQSALNNISGLINEREEHLAHIERLQELNTRLLKEAQSNDNGSPNTKAKRDLKIAQIAFQEGTKYVLEQLQGQTYDTDYNIEESVYDNSFSVTFEKEVEVCIDVDDMLSEIYEDYLQENIDKMFDNVVLPEIDEAPEEVSFIQPSTLA
tara:strand:+ start:27007 stop:27483 length:477 start_codon:yes stop_codon:yes gene_type:complete